MSELPILPAEEQDAIVSLCILAAAADGKQSDLERREISRIATSYSRQGLDLITAHQYAVTGKLRVQQCAERIASASGKTLAYEMALCVCNADGALSAAEERFLRDLGQSLGLDPRETKQFGESAAAITQSATPPPVPGSKASEAELDKLILNRSILAGALELMPQTLSTMAIVPVQMQLVYQLGANYGYKLDMSHAKEFLATAGVSLSSQVVEGYLTKMVGKLAGKFAGRMVTGLVKQATESALAFATTYAIGQAAKRYYAGGRKLTGTQLQNVFQEMAGKGRSLQGQYAGEIAQRASKLSVSDIIPLVKAA